MFQPIGDLSLGKTLQIAQEPEGKRVKKKHLKKLASPDLKRPRLLTQSASLDKSE